jgi:hypothetical protein
MKYTNLLLSHGHSSGHGDSLPPESDKTPTALLAVLLVGLVGLLLFVIVFARQLLWITSSIQNEQVNASVANPELLELKAKWSEDLSSYNVVDAASGVYQIPVDAAIAELVKARQK